MNSTRLRIMELSAKGYLCSQIILKLGLEADNESQSLIRAVGGLAHGCGEGSCTCGALTGGCCLLSLLTEKETPDCQKLISELAQWFWMEYGFRYAGIDCMAIRDADAVEPMETRCWIIIENIYNKICEILITHGFSINNRNHYSN